MKNRANPIGATLAILFTLTACADTPPAPDAMPPNATPAPEVAAALDMADALEIEWGAAPWSPPGWPLKVGDRISREALVRLDKSFSPSWVDGVAVNWVDDLPFVGRFYLTEGANETHTYHGHFPLKADRLYKALLPKHETEFLPPHLWGRDVDHLFRKPGDPWVTTDCTFVRSPCGTLADLRERWHEPWLRKHGDSGKDGAP